MRLGGDLPSVAMPLWRLRFPAPEPQSAIAESPIFMSPCRTRHLTRVQPDANEPEEMCRLCSWLCFPSCGGCYKDGFRGIGFFFCFLEGG